jgi:flagellin
MQISTNINALNALKGIYAANAVMSQASERISTGLRINHASDDPAGLGVANRLKTQVGSFNKVLDNLSQGTAVTQIVDDSLSQISDLLSYVRVAAVASESSTLATSDRTAYQDAIDAYVDEIDSISSNAVWNSSSLMSTSSSMTIQSGINSGDTTSLSFDKITASELGVSSLSVSSADNATTAVTAIDVAIAAVSTYQAYIGAKANVLDVQTNLATSNITNDSVAYGKIMNADMAQETSNLASAQIQRDAATAMLVQSGSMNKELVSYLLKSVMN